MWQYNAVVTLEETCNTQSHQLNVRNQPEKFHSEIRLLRNSPYLQRRPINT